MNSMLLTLVYPTKTVVNSIKQLEIATDVGTRTILPGHSPLYAALKENSQLLVTNEKNKIETINVINGIAAINRTSIQVIITEA